MKVLGISTAVPLLFVSIFAMVTSERGNRKSTHDIRAHIMKARRSPAAAPAVAPAEAQAAAPFDLQLMIFTQMFCYPADEACVGIVKENAPPKDASSEWTFDEQEKFAVAKAATCEMDVECPVQDGTKWFEWCDCFDKNLQAVHWIGVQNKVREDIYTYLEKPCCQLLNRQTSAELGKQCYKWEKKDNNDNNPIHNVCWDKCKDFYGVTDKKTFMEKCAAASNKG